MHRIAITALLVLGLEIQAWGQGLSNGPYRINPIDLNSGGVTSSSGVYQIDSSAGQATGVGTTADGPYELRTGFWPGVAALSEEEMPTPTQTPPPDDPTPTPTLDSDDSGRIDSVDLLTAVDNLRDESGTASDLLLLLGLHWYQSTP